MSQPVYIQRVAGYLPGEPVANDAMETILGQVGPRPSRARRLVLRSNGIRERYYAIDPQTGASTHNNAQLTAAAIQALASRENKSGFNVNDIDLLSCGTSSPDQLMPNHAAMVHGELGNAPCEVAAFAGICISGVSALRYAALSIAAGEIDTAVATGSELASSFMRAGMFDDQQAPSTESLRTNPEQAFHRDFLRWMLSDGAGAALLRKQPAANGLSLRVNWIEQRSFANQLPSCMYAGAAQRADGTLKGWREFDTPQAAVQAGAFSVKQDVRLLNENIVDVSFRDGLGLIRKKRKLEAEGIDWFLPHYSSAYFRPRLLAMMQTQDFVIPESRWFTNLAEVGNIGSASIYLMLASLLKDQRLKAGQNILGFVPESGRFSTAFMHFTVVENES